MRLEVGFYWPETKSIAKSILSSPPIGVEEGVIVDVLKRRLDAFEDILVVCFEGG